MPGDGTRTARTRDEIEVRVGVGRVGHELFPALILALAMIMAAEQLLANRFYESVGATGQVPAKGVANLAGGVQSAAP